MITFSHIALVVALWIITGAAGYGLGAGEVIKKYKESGSVYFFISIILLIAVIWVMVV